MPHSTSSLEVRHASPIGAEIVGADVDTLLHDERVPDLVMHTLEQNGVVFFRALGVDDRQQIAFGERLGEVVRGFNSGGSAQNPEIYFVGFGDELNNELYVRGSFNWHLDGSTDPIPSKASMLSGRAIAAEGGNTQFVSTYDAYDRLSAEEKANYADLVVEHSPEAAYRMFDPNPSEEMLVRLRRVTPRQQPLVWTHRDGRKSLVLGATAGRIVGMPDDEGRALLADLLDRTTRPEHVYTHEWTVGDLVIWDNRGTLHRATPYAEDSGRRMHRITLVGDEPIV